MTQSSKTYNGLDLVKGIMAVLVVAIHTSPLASVNPKADFFLVQVLGRLAVPFFFIAAGFLLFKPGVTTARIIKYAKRVVLLYLGWSAVYFIWQAVQWTMQDSWTTRNLIGYARNFLFSGGYYVLWFFPALLTGVLLYALLRKYLKPRTIVMISGVLFLAGLFGQTYHGLLAYLPPALTKAFNLYIRHFLTTRNGFFYGFFAVSVGAFLSAYQASAQPFWLKAKAKWPLIGLALLGIALFAAEVYVIASTGLALRRDMYLLQVPAATAIFCFALSLRLADAPVYRFLRDAGLYLFLTQGVFIIIQSQFFKNMHSLGRFAFVLIGSLALSFLLFYLPGLLRKPKAPTP